MMESSYPIVDKISSLLAPTGIIGVADFYTPNKHTPSDPVRHLSFLSRWFWQIWFDFDNVFLHSSRREYLEYKFVTIKCVSGLNRFFGPVVRIPYYIWLGGQPGVVHLNKQETGGSVNALAPPSASIGVAETQDSTVPSGDGFYVVGARKLVNHTHVHGQGMLWRQPFDHKLLSKFHSYIYGFTWEDPR